MSEEVKYWSCNRDADYLTHQSIEFAIDEFLEDVEPPEWPDEVVVYGFAPMEVRFSGYARDNMLDELVESLDEDYGDPYGNSDDYRPSDAVKAKADELLRLMEAEYPCWTCEEVETVTVPLRDYVPLERSEDPDVMARMARRKESRG